MYAYTLLDKTEPDNGPAHYRLRTTLPTLYELELTQKRLYLALQGRCHTQFCLKLCASIKQREEAQSKRRTRSFLLSVLGESNTGVCLDYLCVDKDTLLNNGPEIFKKLTEHYEEHYSTPMRHQGPIHTDPELIRIYTDKQKFIQVTNHHNIPESLREIIWEAMHPPNVAGAKKQLETLLETPPSWEQHMKAVKLKKRDTAGGPTGATYTQMSFWPESVHRAVYQSPSTMWPSRPPPC
jgi:hypothetical protein